MSETILVEKKKKKKIDFSLLRKLEDEYDEAVEDAERKEEILIKKVHADYLNAENKSVFFEGLQKSQRWYYDKFQLHSLQLERPKHSEGMKLAHAERKKQQVLEDLAKMEKDVETMPVVDIDPDIVKDTGYVDPREEKRDWIRKTKEELKSEKPMKLKGDSNYGKYQETKSNLMSFHNINKSSFEVSDKYRNLLIHQFKKEIEYLTNLLGEIEK